MRHQYTNTQTMQQLHAVNMRIYGYGRDTAQINAYQVNDY